MTQRSEAFMDLMRKYEGYITIHHYDETMYQFGIKTVDADFYPSSGNLYFDLGSSVALDFDEAASLENILRSKIDCPLPDDVFSDFMEIFNLTEDE